MITLKEVRRRWASATPLFFKRVILLCQTAGGSIAVTAGGFLIGSDSQYAPSHIPGWTMSFLSFMLGLGITLAVTGTAVSKLVTLWEESCEPEQKSNGAKKGV